MWDKKAHIMDWLRTLTGHITALLITNLLLVFILLPIGLRAHGSNGAIAVGLALGICLLANLPVLLFSSPSQTPQGVLLHMALSCGIRMGLPIAVCIAIAFQRSWLFEADFVYYLMTFYFVMLILETITQVACLQATPNEPMEA